MSTIEKALAKFASAVRVACEELSRDMNEAMPKFAPASEKPPQPAQSKSTFEPTFPDPLDRLVVITDEGDHWKVKFKQFVQTDDFAMVAKIVKEYGGEYYSLGKNSHFKIPKKTP
jgi:hypothetical protein